MVDNKTETLDNIKVKRDLHTYMVDIRKCLCLIHSYICSEVGEWLPSLRTCRLSFLQQILQDKKKTIKTKDIKMLNVQQNWPDWQVKHAWLLIKADETVHPYLPVEEMNYPSTSTAPSSEINK